MTHQEIEEKEIIERYVLHQLAPEERRAFQEHYFSCDECFDRAQTEARFIASVRVNSKTGVLAAERRGRPADASSAMPSASSQRWARGWLIPAFAATLFLAFVFAGLWALSLRRENRNLAEQAIEQGRASERLTTKAQQLEANESELQKQTESLREENNRLKEQISANERGRETELARLREPDINVPIRNIYPVNDQQRSAAAGEINRVSMPRGTRTFVLILGDYKPGLSNYRLEIRDASGRLVATREGLKPDQAGDLSVLLNRAMVSRGKYSLKLYGQQKQIAEYIILVE